MSVENTAAESAKPKWRYLLPLAAFLALAVLLGAGLGLNPREVPSPLVGKPAPHFELPQLHRADAKFSQADMLGKVWMLNVWASWCAGCRDEHPLLVQMAKSGVMPIVGLNYKDKREDGIAWLLRFGDPYLVSAFDEQGRIGIDYGVYGVPETYVIDKRGVIRYKRIGIVTPEIVNTRILPLVGELNREP
ncbi:MAG: DsbE family thiol:disulfide interchange protein [Burkholderiales bacterium]|jgi:cytochrome c biogenesis protein CcmG/thiol:disulfide interchange protein DsbE|nr:DsbE family thiol:disulfide interchange protein [Burkholderiales bacterium]